MSQLENAIKQSRAEGEVRYETGKVKRPEETSSLRHAASDGTMSTNPDRLAEDLKNFNLSRGGKNYNLSKLSLSNIKNRAEQVKLKKMIINEFLIPSSRLETELRTREKDLSDDLNKLINISTEETSEDGETSEDVITRMSKIEKTAREIIKINDDIIRIGKELEKEIADTVSKYKKTGIFPKQTLEQAKLNLNREGKIFPNTPEEHY